MPIRQTGKMVGVGLIVLWASIAGTQFFYDRQTVSKRVGPRLLENIATESFSLPAEILKKISLGLDNVLADWTWLQTIQYYGGGKPGGIYRQLPTLLNTVTTLDPRFSYPYAFGVLVLPGEGFVNEALALGQKGLTNKDLRSNWEIPYYTGMIYHFYKHDFGQAARLFDEAGQRSGAPDVTRLMAANYYGKANERETAYNLYAIVYQTTKNDYIKQRAAIYLEHWQLIFALEGAAGKFKETEGRFPADLQELVAKGIIKALPNDPLGVKLTINPQTGVVTEVPPD